MKNGFMGVPLTVLQKVMRSNANFEMNLIAFF